MSTWRPYPTANDRMRNMSTGLEVTFTFRESAPHDPCCSGASNVNNEMSTRHVNRRLIAAAVGGTPNARPINAANARPYRAGPSAAPPRPAAFSGPYGVAIAGPSSSATASPAVIDVDALPPPPPHDPCCSGASNVNIEMSTRHVNRRMIAAAVGGTPNAVAFNRPPHYAVPDATPYVAASNRPPHYAVPDATPYVAASNRPHYAAPNARPINAANARPYRAGPSAAPRPAAFSGPYGVAIAGPSSSATASPAVIDVDALPPPPPPHDPCCSGASNVNIEMSTRHVNRRMIAAAVGGTPNAVASNRPPHYAVPDATPYVAASNRPPHYTVPDATPYVAASNRPHYAAPNARPINAANARPYRAGPSAAPRPAAFSGPYGVAIAGPSSSVTASPAVIDVDALPPPPPPAVDLPPVVIDLCESDNESMSEELLSEQDMELCYYTTAEEEVVEDDNDSIDDEASAMDNEDVQEMPDHDPNNDGRPAASDDDGPYSSDSDDDDSSTFGDADRPSTGRLFMAGITTQVDRKIAPLAVEFPLSLEAYLGMVFTDLPKGHVLLLLTGAPLTSNVNGSARIMRLALVRRLLRLTRFVSTHVKQSDRVDAINSSICNSKHFISPGHMDHMTLFIHKYGISQKFKVARKNKKFASYDCRVKSFERCSKSLLSEVSTLCEAGLFYKGYGDDDIMFCYCCGTYFRLWKYLMIPWVQHAIRSPECTFLLLVYGSQFVEKVHSTYHRIKTCSVREYQELFYDSFSDYDLGFMDKTLADGDDEGRALCVDRMVSCQVAKLYPELRPKKNEPPPKANDQLPKTDDKAPLSIDVTCKICYREKIEVLFIPCGHLYTCTQCAVILDECAVCREPFGDTTYVMKVNLLEKEDYESATTTVSNGSEDNAMCRLCFREPIGMAFVPCLHVLSCYQCAISVEKCPVCEQQFFGLIQVYL